MTKEKSTEERHLYWNKLAVLAVKDEAAFIELYNEFFPVVYKFLLSKSRSGEIADEAVSRTFLNMYAHLSEYDESRGAFSTWLFRIAINELRMMFREKGRSLSTEWDENFDPPAPEKDSPETRILKRERDGELHQALARLSEREQKILTMTYWLEMSAGEIAEELGMTSDAVWAVLSRSRKTLKKYLEEGQGV
jgi:RNA polymerase sigma-70 factor (ECF subfamily)